MNTVSINNFSFNPQVLNILPGDVVTWANNDNVVHTTTSDTGVWDSGELRPGQSFQFGFSQGGMYNYHCNVHPAMKGTISAGPAADDSPE
ncbi:plastocyanin/azurin family copper-binding protein [Streptomyces olivoreticuli]|uniref:plastocyanin/azurin family copper-binding protein n=1 Tax=Streptomyces olivoreticuli TaxID=68246 RepID=UPI0013C2C9E1|nr:plastocyanin/azurin family copper-binding protein [Streptomyces olivoreticuli]